MRLFSYVVARDYGFAPNPFFGFCTLATCKPGIRKSAEVGDWVVGTGSKAHARQGYLVYVMRLSEVLTFDRYWSDERFYRKRPNLKGSWKQAYGDNIYHKDNDGMWRQQDSHHSYKYGRQNQQNISRDTFANSVLIGEHFTYWGGKGPIIPSQFRNWNGEDICKSGPGYKCNFPNGLICQFVKWARDLECGYRGEPLDWKHIG